MTPTAMDECIEKPPCSTICNVSTKKADPAILGYIMKGQNLSKRDKIRYKTGTP